MMKFIAKYETILCLIGIIVGLFVIYTMISKDDVTAYVSNSSQVCKYVEVDGKKTNCSVLKNYKKYDVVYID